MTDSIYKIILSVLADEATQEEHAIFTEWLEQSVHNKEEYDKIKQLYTASVPPKKEKNYNTESAWRKVYKQTVAKKRQHTLFYFIRYAAIIIIIITAGSYFFVKTPRITKSLKDFQQPTLLLDNGKEIALAKKSFSLNQTDITISNDSNNQLSYISKSKQKQTPGKSKNNHLFIPKGNTYELLLSDGTHVWLNSETEIIYPARFTGNTREVILKGEAFFKVAKNKEKPFIVKTNAISIQVLGTTFNVSHYANEKNVSATLVEGSISVQTEKGPKQIITPSEQFIYNNTSGESNIRIVDTHLYTSWIEGKYIFKNAPLEEIITKLQRWYDFTVSYNDNSLKARRFSLTIERKTTLDQVLEIISLTSDVKLEKVKNNIIIKERRKYDLK